MRSPDNRHLVGPYGRTRLPRWEGGASKHTRGNVAAVLDDDPSSSEKKQNVKDKESPTDRVRLLHYQF